MLVSKVKNSVCFVELVIGLALNRAFEQKDVFIKEFMSFLWLAHEHWMALHSELFFLLVTAPFTSSPARGKGGGADLFILYDRVWISGSSVLSKSSSNSVWQASNRRQQNLLVNRNFLVLKGSLSFLKFVQIFNLKCQHRASAFAGDRHHQFVFAAISATTEPACIKNMCCTTLHRKRNTRLTASNFTRCVESRVSIIFDLSRYSALSRWWMTTNETWLDQSGFRTVLRNNSYMINFDP